MRPGVRGNTTVRDKNRAAVRRGHPDCHLCEQPIDYTLSYPHAGSFVVDHVVPIARGGVDVLSNMKAAHRHPRLQPLEGRQVDERAGHRAAALGRASHPTVGHRAFLGLGGRRMSLKGRAFEPWGRESRVCRNRGWTPSWARPQGVDR